MRTLLAVMSLSFLLACGAEFIFTPSAQNAPACPTDYSVVSGHGACADANLTCSYTSDRARPCGAGLTTVSNCTCLVPSSSLDAGLLWMCAGCL